MGPDERVDLADAGQEDHVMRLSLDGGADPRHNVGRRIEYALQELLDLGFFAVGLDFEELLKDAAFFEDLQGDVVEAEVEHAHAGMADAGYKVLAVLDHGQAFSGREGAYEEGDLVAEPLLRQKSLARNDPIKVFGTLLAIQFRLQLLRSVNGIPGK